MRTITLSGSDEAVSAFLDANRDALEAAGIEQGEGGGQEAAAPAPAGDQEPPPDDVLQARGLSREEWLRARDAGPAAEVGGQSAAAPQEDGGP